jgi:hypothetical protein
MLVIAEIIMNLTSYIPRQRGKRPVPATRNVPVGILRERMAVIPPKRKMMVPDDFISFHPVSPLKPNCLEISKAVFITSSLTNSWMTFLVTRNPGPETLIADTGLPFSLKNRGCYTADSTLIFFIINGISLALHYFQMLL